ncbi:sensor domain-containing diguanylate cyclase [Pseudodesulfovibrio methanolicus]|uniref:Sensor domain-containing diguanylate cyclase n=1 Tax=Pseudodesulfovibrio methanolicus TaxID=3126690 RepID=A0ABZ2IYZ7_9BACT
MFFKQNNRTDIGKMPGEDHQVVRGTLRTFIVLLLTVGALLALGGTVLYRMEQSEFLDRVGTVEFGALDQQSAAIARELDRLVADVLYLSKQNELILLLDTGDRKAVRDMEREYLQLARNRRAYAQIRYIDASGKEKVRVDSRDGRTSAVPDDRLQDKSQRYYLKECLALGEGGIYLSPMDLNMENGAVERPARPMLRIGTPVFDSMGRKRGIVLINYNAQTLLDRILRTGTSSVGQSMLLNRRGYWLLSPDKNKEWGFMAPKTRDVSFAMERPDEWKWMLSRERGQVGTDNGLFTFTMVRPLDEMRQFGMRLRGADDERPAAEASSPYFWMLVSRVPPETLARHARALLLKLFTGGGALFLLIAFGAWHLALAVSRRRLYQEQLVAAAMFDALTGLPNRKLFFDRLEASLALSIRYGRRLGLLYIDLDGFKAVNDTMGHEAGDELLKRVGRLLTGSVRKSDTVARLGGDEFVVMLNEVTNLGDAALVGEKLVSALRAPITLKTGTATISASVGVSVYPENGESAELLVQKADQAMYASKHKGKSTCTMADSSRCADA